MAECAVKTLFGCNVCNYVKDEGWPLVTDLQELVAPVLYAALLKRQGGERYIKSRHKPAGTCIRDDRKGTIDEASKTVQTMSEPGLFCQTRDKSGRNLFTVRVASGAKIA